MSAEKLKEKLHKDMAKPSSFDEGIKLYFSMSSYDTKWATVRKLDKTVIHSMLRNKEQFEFMITRIIEEMNFQCLEESLKRYYTNS